MCAAPRQSKQKKSVSHGVRSLVSVALLLLTGGFRQVTHSAGPDCPDATARTVLYESFGQRTAPSVLNDRTRYALVSATCPNDGQYALAPAIDGRCFDGLWHAIPDDHTPGDEGGLMMIANGSYGAGDVYVQPASGLCSQTTYELSVWCVNLLKPGYCTNPLLPNLTLRVEAADGTEIQTIDVGVIPLSSTPVWQRFSTVFTLPASIDGVVIKLINNQGSAGCGNDLALDDLQLRQCGACAPTPAGIPDAFSPNNDGVNDVFRLALPNAESGTLTIFDRWGAVLYRGDARHQAWDGTASGLPCAPGSYSWQLSYRLSGANPAEPARQHYGRVVLIR